MGTKRKILVVDDDHDGAVSLGMLLEIEGHDVTVRFDGAAALACLEVERPQIVLLDLTMPEMSGYELCRKIRAAAWGDRVFVFALTGWTHVESEALAAGFDGCLVKPCATDQLRRVVADPAGESLHLRERYGPQSVAGGKLGNIEEA